MADKKKESKEPEKKEPVGESEKDKNSTPASKDNGLDTRSVPAEPLLSDALISKINSFLFFAGILFLSVYWVGNYFRGVNSGSCPFSLDKNVKTEVRMIYPGEEVFIDFEPCREMQLAPDKPVVLQLADGKKFFLKVNRKLFRIRPDGSIDDKNEIENLGEIPGLTLLIKLVDGDETEAKLVITTWRK